MHDEDTNAKNLFSSFILSSSPNPHQMKKQSLKTRERFMNYKSSVAALSLGMSTVVLLTSQEDRRRRQDIFLHNPLISAL